MQLIAPQKFTLKRRCMFSRLPSAIGANSPTPALLTRMSTAPNSSTVLRTRASTANLSVTSVGTTKDRPCKDSMSLARALSLSLFRAASTRFAPLRLNSRAADRPMPEEAPVIIAVQPSIRMSLRLERALSEPIGNLGPEPADGVLPCHEANVTTLENDVFF